MPEGPEVEAARRLAAEHCVNKVITDLTAQDDEKVYCGESAANVVSALKGKRVDRILRKGKYFWFEVQDPEAREPSSHILFHFGMAGYLSIKGKGSAKYVRIKNDTEWPPKYCKLELCFEDGTQLAFMDARRFARIRLLKDVHAAEPVSKLGPDAFLQLPPIEEFGTLIRKQRRNLKTVLLDQAVLSGIGNWVADEVMYQASLHPEIMCSNMTDDQLVALRSKIADVFEVAISVDSDSARLPPDWLFHFRWTGKVATKDFHGQQVQFATVGGRTTAFVPARQKKRSAQAASKAKGAAAIEPTSSTSASGDDATGTVEVETEVAVTSVVVNEDGAAGIEASLAVKKTSGTSRTKKAARRGTTVVAVTQTSVKKAKPAPARAQPRRVCKR